MFDLERAISDWRKEIAATGIKKKEVLDELESHLRDEIEQRIGAGADEEQAFEAAVRAIGEPAVLRAEFMKSTRTDDGAKKFLRVFYFSSIAFVLLINLWTLLEYETSLWERVFGFSAVSIIALYLACLPCLLNSLAADVYARFARVTKMGSNLILLWPIWELLEAEHIVPMEFGIVPKMILWCLCAAIGLTLLANVLNNQCSSGGGDGGAHPPFQPHPEPIPPTRPFPADVPILLPPKQRFAPVALEALEAAGEEASRLGHDFIGTEHVLLGTLKLAKGSFEQLLRQLSLNRETVRAEIEQWVSAVPAHAGKATVPFTPRACRALRFAAREAKKLNQNCVGAEHIFLGLLLEGTGIAGQVLRKLGIRVERAREEILSELRGRPNC